jgi:hypothetical protein
MIARILLLIGLSFSASAAWMGDMWSPQYGDARRAADVRDLDYMAMPNPGMVDIRIPDGEWHALTVTMWLRFRMSNTNYPARNNNLTTTSFWCPEPIRRDAPDLTGGTFGYPNGTNLSGSASVAFDFPRENGYAPTNVFPRGAYTISGWASNSVTVTLGGKDIAVGPGEFNRNAEPGESDGIIVSGSGPISVAVSRLHAHQFFQAIDGALNAETVQLSDETVITNEIVFVAFRIRLDASNHIYRADLCHLGRCDPSGQTKTNALPNDPAVRSLSSRGMYRFGMAGLAAPTNTWSFDVFGVRGQTKWLSDAELDARIYSNDAEEIVRRPIPQWR